MTRPRLFWLLRFLTLFAVACQPDIGDPCTIPSDCSLTGDRLCDTNQVGGYCTKFNCEPGNCPEEAVCVAFRGSASAAPECRDPQGTPRLERTFCMKKCGRDGDCRTSEGYACVDPESVEAWGASVVERGGSAKICIAPYSSEPVAPSSTDVCSPPADASFPPPLVSPSDAGEGPRGDAAVDGAGPPDASQDAPGPGTDAAGTGRDASRDAPADG